MSTEIRAIAVEEPVKRGAISKLLAGGMISLVGEATYGPEAVSVAEDLRPDVVVIGLDDPIVRPLRTIEILSVAAPNAGIVALSEVNDLEAIRKATRAGARDCLIQPVRAETLQRAVTAVYEAEQKRHQLGEPERRKQLHRGDVIVLFGAKGGIGKTTLAVNLATAIAQTTKQKVALVDLDLQLGDVALMLSISPQRSVIDAVASGERLTPDLLQSLVIPDSSGVQVLPAPRTPEETGSITAADIRRVLEALSHSYDYVVVDTTPALSELNLVALELATLTLLVTAPELPSLKRTKLVLGLLANEWKYPEDQVKLVLNLPHPKDGISPIDAAAALNHPIYRTIPYDPLISRASRQGRPSVEVTPRSPFSESTVELARTLTGNTIQRKGLLQRLLRR